MDRTPNIRAELYKWFGERNWDVAITLTFADEVSEGWAMKTCQKFWREVDYAVYRNASRRYGTKCERVMVLEGDGDGQRFHLHGSAITPTHFASTAAFCSFLENRWLRLHPRSHRVEFKPIWECKGWNWYISKRISRFECDRFDVHSSHIAATNLLTASRAYTAAHIAQ